MKIQGRPATVSVKVMSAATSAPLTMTFTAVSGIPVVDIVGMGDVLTVTAPGQGEAHRYGYVSEIDM